MVTTEAFDPHPDRTRWPRRSAAAAIATVVVGVGGTGLAVGILSARQPDTSGGTQATSSTDDGSESEPVSRKDRLLLALAPHLVLDGATGLAQALGAPQVLIAVHDAERS